MKRALECAVQYDTNVTPQQKHARRDGASHHSLMHMSPIEEAVKQINVNASDEGALARRPRMLHKDAYIHPEPAAFAFLGPQTQSQHLLPVSAPDQQQHQQQSSRPVRKAQLTIDSMFNRSHRPDAVARPCTLQQQQQPAAAVGTGSQTRCHVCLKLQSSVSALPEQVLVSGKSPSAALPLALCTFCDKAACSACSRRCENCAASLCTLCSIIDYSGQYDRQLCPSCSTDSHTRQLEGADDMMDCS
jgi:Cd27 binding protein (Siva)